ncbi:MAG: YkgJ family cysteine cluster protein [Bacteroidales bacterium]|nr:YkgJ family cysteine cluster protein [Bacteroidales bacterium]
MECRPGCGACCIVISISSPIPGMPNGKPAGTPCIHLSADGLCSIFGQAGRPAVCSGFKAERAICGKNREEAIKNLARLEGLNYKNLHFKNQLPGV